MSLSFNIVTAENGQTFVTVFANGTLSRPADDSDPNFQAIVEACQASMRGELIDPAGVLELFDVAKTVERKFARYSDRVTIVGNEVLFDGDPAQPGLSKQILRYLDEGADVKGLVNFMEKIEANPIPHSKQQAWDWLNNHDFTVMDDGNIIGYKGVHSDGNGGYQSGFRGDALRNGEPVVNNYVPNAVGDTIEMPRSTVAHDPSESCSTGLHVGTYKYAQAYARGAMLRVIVDPRDIVSVPTDASGEKIRVCRYKVDKIIDAPETTARFSGEAGAFTYTPEPRFEVGDWVLAGGTSGRVVEVDDEDDILPYRVELDDGEWSDWFAADELQAD